MAIINSQVVTVDAILTTKGRELLSRNDGQFQITQFALSDDEIDYTLYNPNHPLGSAYYGEAIENMPVTEASPNDTLGLKYKLVTLPKGTSKLPVISIGYTVISLKMGASLTVTPSTLNYLGSTSVYENSGYIATVADVRLLSAFAGTGIQNAQTISTDQFANAKQSKSQIGTSFSVQGTTIDALFGSNSTKLVTTITFIGRDSGARITIPLEITRK